MKPLTFSTSTLLRFTDSRLEFCCVCIFSAA
jgi:hypothetical protein